MSAEPNVLLELSKLRVSDLLATVGDGRELVSVNADASLKDAFEVVCRNHVHCVPVVAKQEGSGEDVCAGLLDLRDFASYLVTMLTSSSHTPAPLTDAALSLQNYSLVNRFQPVYPETLLSDALTLFAAEKTLHRLPVLRSGCTPSEPVVTHMLSLSSLLQFFAAKSDGLLAGFWKTPLADFADSVVKERVHVAGTTDTLLEALKKLLDCTVNSLPVVDAEGRILGAVSVSDLQYGVLKNLDRLNEPLSSFLLEASRNAEHQFGDEPYFRLSHEPVVCKLADTIGAVIDRMLAKHISHVWLVDDNGTPVGVVAGYDVVGALATYLLATVVSN